MGATAGCPRCAEKRSPCWPVSRRTNTSDWNAASLVGASDSVLDALARALQLDDAERDHLFDLARIDNAARATKRAPASRQRLKPVIQQVLDSITEAAADVRNERGDIVASNKLGHALYSEIHAETV